MRTARRLRVGAGFVVDAVTCLDDHHGWSAAERSSGHRVVLVRRGRFRRASRGHAAVVDPTMAYVASPGEEERFAHPAGGDVCTSLHLSPGLWHTLAGDARLTRSTLYVDARLDLAHRRLLSADPADDLAEALLPLISAALSQLATAPTPADDQPPTSPRASLHPSAHPPPSTSASTSLHPSASPSPRTSVRPSARTSASSSARALVDAAREAIADGHPASDALLPLAALLGVSPYRLSRAFTRELGVSLTHYRNRVRVGRALDRLEQGEPSLADLAADLGFADQAHLTRTVRHHLGHTPTALRRLLRP
ncbi:helix-turn-helix domain-containing protein [Nonomuraea sp. NPDC048826]|uniref:helix-turn-helix domain-containing protein n=1 Tax=Nonomuraea sp. NPDC048826 TaxID=3364347 RepID=UPI00371490DD